MKIEDRRLIVKWSEDSLNELSSVGSRKSKRNIIELQADSKISVIVIITITWAKESEIRKTTLAIQFFYSPTFRPSPLLAKHGRPKKHELRSVKVSILVFVVNLDEALCRCLVVAHLLLDDVQNLVGAQDSVAISVQAVEAGRHLLVTGKRWGQYNWWMDGWMNGWMDGRTDGLNVLGGKLLLTK